MKLRNLFCTIMLLSSALFSSHSQTLDEAREWFSEGRFADALPLLRAAHSDMPDNVLLNLQLGVALFETGHILEAQQHLRFAAQRRNTDAHLYLGAIYAMLYRFADADREFNLFNRANLRNAAAQERLAEREDEADRWRRAVTRTENVQIIDSLIVPKTHFLEAFNLSAASGRLEFLPPDDTSLLPGVSHLNGMGDRIHFSSDGNLLSMERLIDGFGNQRTLPEPVNAEGSQAFPFLMLDGLTLYFASTGHNSLGGYDLFITRHNLIANNYLIPTHLNPPFNSPFNDFMLAIDEEKGIGWFVSDRFQPPGYVIVYTFIPNPHVQLIESDDIEYLASRARVDSISATWRENIDYTALRQLARQRVEVQEVNAGDFEFIINDNIVHRTLADFRNPEARALFSQAMMFETQLQTLNSQLQEQRNQFPSNSELRESILGLERHTRELYEEVQRLKVQARNAEIRGF